MRKHRAQRDRADEVRILGGWERSHLIGEEDHRCVCRCEKAADAEEHSVQLRSAELATVGDQVAADELDSPTVAAQSLRFAAEYFGANQGDFVAMQVDWLEMRLDRGSA
jgi:hypothetical protein